MSQRAWLPLSNYPILNRYRCASHLHYFGLFFKHKRGHFQSIRTLYTYRITALKKVQSTIRSILITESSVVFDAPASLNSRRNWGPHNVEDVSSTDQKIGWNLLPQHFLQSPFTRRFPPEVASVVNMPSTSVQNKEDYWSSWEKANKKKMDRFIIDFHGKRRLHVRFSLELTCTAEAEFYAFLFNPALFHPL